MSEKKTGQIPFIATIWTPYLTEGFAKFSRNTCPVELLEQILLYGYNPENLNELDCLRTNGGRAVLLDKSYNDQRARLSDLVIAGNTERSESKVREFKGSGLIVARYSIFYGKPCIYTEARPEDA